jgi:ribosomal protein S18 acetylase RimI-like enzyme
VNGWEIRSLGGREWLLRTGRLEDLRALAALDRRAFEELGGDDPYSYGSFRQFFDLFPDLLLVAERDALLLGYALGGSGSERGWILGVAVEPSAQGGGIGRALTEGLLERMTQCAGTGALPNPWLRAGAQ